MAALMSFVFVAGASAHKIRFDTTVSAKFNKPDKNGSTEGNFDGTVSSQKVRCEKNRTVNLRFRAADGTTPIVGSDLTDLSGAWAIQPAGAILGTYFAQTPKKVLRKTTKHRHVCKKAVSKDVVVK